MTLVRELGLSPIKMIHGTRRQLAMQGYVVGRRLVLTTRTKDGKPASGDFVSVWKR